MAVDDLQLEAGFRRLPAALNRNVGGSESTICCTRLMLRLLPSTRMQQPTQRAP